MQYQAYNELPPVEDDVPVVPIEEECPIVPPSGDGTYPPPPPVKKPKKEKSEHGALFALLLLVVILGGTAILMAFQWQRSTPFVTGYYGILPPTGFDFVLPTAQPTETTITRAPVGDGTTLDLQALAGSESLTLQQIYKAAAPSIVTITATRSSGRAEGTGVIMTENGYVITNAHVIEGAATVEVVTDSGEAYPALLVGQDATTDLAVLKVSATGLPIATFGDSDTLEVGDAVVAIGNPLGSELRGTMTDGILSAVNREVDVDGNTMTLLQTTAALNSGNSGGALLNDRGQVIGITNMKMVNTGFSAPVEGLGFAIPTATVKSVVDALIESGYVTGRPVLGIVVRPGYDDERAPYEADYGLYVSQVSQGSDAEIQGLKPGDMLLTANGERLYTNADLLDLRTPLTVGDSLDFLVGRNGATLTLTVKLVEQYQITQ